MVIIEIDGRAYKADSAKMLIEVTDELGIAIPRFCYHKKLSIAANCRMCLIEVENAGKPLPACATPVTEGMKVFTRSTKALAAQKAVMEFLLINHPLDCPICDQGGECELQDVSMGFGKDISRFTEDKRVVNDENLGSLIATDMTRCIHCTRCVRFGEEVAGLRELGVTDRGEAMKIGTYVKQSMRSELSGNIIDLCPVGALTSKPFRFKARAWELTQVESIAPHDALGSNVSLHTLSGKVMRVVPKENEAVNETWISDRDRFSYVGLTSEDRVGQPLIKQGDKWQTVTWEVALKRVVERLQTVINQSGAQQIAAVGSPSATVEEAYLLQKLMREIGVGNIDHRIHQTDFSDQHLAPLYLGMKFPFADLEKQQAILLLGVNLHRELPLAAVRVRKAALNGAKVSSLNVVDDDFNFTLAEKIITSPAQLMLQLAQVVKSVATDRLPSQATELLEAVGTHAVANNIATSLKEADKGAIIIGAMAMNHPQAASIRSLAQLLASATKAKLIYLTEGANSAGAALAGMLPHRMAGGVSSPQFGLDVYAAWQAQLKAYVMLGIEPEYDCADPGQVRRALAQADFVVMLTAFKNDTMLAYADVILPITPFTETSGTFVNLEGRWQSFKGCVKPYEQARPAWKVLRVLGNYFNLPGFDYVTSDAVLSELKASIQADKFPAQAWYCPTSLQGEDASLLRISEWPIYAGDSLTRRSQPLQESATNDPIVVRINATLAKQLKLNTAKLVTVKQGTIACVLPLVIDERIPDNCVYLVNGVAQTINLGEPFGPIKLEEKL